MLFPILFPTLALSAGILFSSYLPLPLNVLVILLILSLSFAWALYGIFRKPRASFTLILTTTLLLGACLFTLKEQRYEENALKNWLISSYADYCGTLVKSPSREKGRDLLFLKVTSVTHENQEKKITGNMRVAVLRSDSFPLPPLLVGDVVKVSAKMTPSHGFRNFLVPSLELYLKANGIHNRASTKSPLLVERLGSGKSLSPLRFISIVRQKLQQKIENHFRDPHSQSLSPQGAILEALLLGERGRLDEDHTRSLQNAGLFHLFAISGAHIAIISFLLFSLFKMVRMPTRLSYVVLMIFLVSYALLVEGRPSVVRATVMALAFLLGKLIWKNVNLINTLSISAFILLISNPFHLFSLGFQLTFAATLSIILFFPKIIKYLPRLPLRISEIFAITLTAQLGVLPFIAYAFNRVTFSPLVLNFAALPLVGSIMACGYLFLPLSFASPSTAEIIARPIQVLIDLLIGTSHLFDNLSFLSFRIPTPHPVIMIGYFLSLALFLIPTRIRGQKGILALCFLGFFAVLVLYPFPSGSKNLKVTFIDVGQGDSILIDFPGSKKMLIDGGGMKDESYDIGERVVSPFLWRKGIKKIDRLVLTHAHPDHMNGLKSVARNFKILEYWEGLSPSDDNSYSELKNVLLREIPKKRLSRGESLYIDGVKIDVLNPVLEEPETESAHNNHSVVLRLTYGQTSFLLPGDIEEEIENSLVDSEYSLRSLVLKSPHHGSRSSNSPEFLKAVSPTVVVISVAAGNMYQHPDDIVLERYRATGAEIYRTDHHGAVEVSSDGRDISVRTAVKRQ